MKVKLDLRDLSKKCPKNGCSYSGSLYRHHKGNDRWVGRFYREIGKRYYEWRDCVRICDRCHMGIHYLYDQELIKIDGDGETERAKYIAITDRFLADPNYPNVPKEFKLRWRQSHKRWMKEQKEYRRQLRKEAKAQKKKSQSTKGK